MSVLEYLISSFVRLKVRRVNNIAFGLQIGDGSSEGSMFPDALELLAHMPRFGRGNRSEIVPAMERQNLSGGELLLHGVISSSSTT